LAFTLLGAALGAATLRRLAFTLLGTTLRTATARHLLSGCKHEAAQNCGRRGTD
jgi:hypothetical protein